MKLEIQLWACVILWQMHLCFAILSGNELFNITGVLWFVYGAGTYIMIDKKRARVREYVESFRNEKS